MNMAIDSGVLPKPSASLTFAPPFIDLMRVALSPSEIALVKPFLDGPHAVSVTEITAVQMANLVN
jgi:hypothetical protein